MANTISIENDTTGEAISITRTWAKSDVIEVDVANKTVKINGIEEDYDGSFPNFSPGTHNLIITDDFSVRTFTVTVDYTKRYL